MGLDRPRGDLAPRARPAPGGDASDAASRIEASAAAVFSSWLETGFSWVAIVHPFYALFTNP